MNSGPVPIDSVQAPLVLGVVSWLFAPRKRDGRKDQGVVVATFFGRFYGQSACSAL